MKSNTRFKN